jgi:hypothetical protein
MILLLAATTLAHGPPAAVIGVAAVDGAGPTHVAFTEGIGLRTPEGWRYICPARWGGSPLAPRAAGTPDSVWIPGADDLYQMDEDGQTVSAGHPELAITGLLALTDGDDPLGLYVAGDGRELVRLSDQAVLWSDAGSWSGVVELGGQIHLAREHDGQLERAILDAGGAELSRAEEGPIEGPDPLLRVSGKSLYAVDRGSGRNALVEIPGTSIIFEAVNSLSGPVPAGEGVVFAGDGVLYWLVDPLVRTPETASIGCLVARGGSDYACSRNLYELAATGTRQQPPILALEAVLPPLLDDLDGDAAVSCWGQWRQYAYDIGIEPGDFPTPPVDAMPASSGCGCAVAGGPQYLWIAALVAGSLRRQRPPTRLHIPHESNGTRGAGGRPVPF